MGAKLGRAMRDMRKATRAISSEINATRDAITAEAKPITDPLQEVAGAAKSAGSLVAAAKNPGQAIRDSVLKELNPSVEPATPAADEPENTIAPPVNEAAAEQPAPVALPGPAEITALPASEPTGADSLPAPVEAETPAVNAAPAMDTLTVTEPPVGDTPAPKKRKPRAKKTSPEPAGVEPVAGEQ
jgi:hypothetical protein